MRADCLPLSARGAGLSPELGEALARVAEGATMPRGLAVALLDAAVPLAPLLAAASTLRDRGKGRTITVSPKVFLPLTTLCRDHCGYCAFRREPGAPDAGFLTPDEILATVAEGERQGCSEALFTMGDAPEAALVEARDALRRLGYRRTLDYLGAMCTEVLERSSLLPHSNPGLLAAPDLLALKRVNASLGVMLESTSERLTGAGGPHAGTVTKQPAARRRVLELAGELRIPFTTGILVGIGESAAERLDALLAIRRLHERFGHIQEVIVQPFRPGAASSPAYQQIDAETLLRTTAVARLLLGANANLQVPPNLFDDYGRLLDAGINDWGGVSPVTPDFVNPRSPWPKLSRLRALTEARGFALRARLPVYPEYLLGGRDWLAPAIRARAIAAVGSDGLRPEPVGDGLWAR